MTRLSGVLITVASGLVLAACTKRGRRSTRSYTIEYESIERDPARHAPVEVSRCTR